MKSYETSFWFVTRKCNSTWKHFLLQKYKNVKADGLASNAKWSYTLSEKKMYAL